MIKVIFGIIIGFLIFIFLFVFNFNNFEPCQNWNCINSFAPWLSAFGTIFISGVSLWLSIKDKLIRVNGSFRMGVIPSDLVEKKVLDREVFILSFVNVGARKVKISNFKFVRNNKFLKKEYIYLFPQLDESLKSINPQFPILLEEMDSKNIFFDINFFLNLNHNSKSFFFHTNYLYNFFIFNTMYVILETVTGKQIKIKVHKDVINKLLKQRNIFLNHNKGF